MFQHATASVDDYIAFILVETKHGMAKRFSKGKRSPLFSMAYLAVKQNGGKDWYTGIALSQNNRGKSHKIEFHHIFPRALLQKAGYEKSEINEIANMGFHRRKNKQTNLSKKPCRIPGTDCF